MSVLLDRQITRYRTSLAGDRGDAATYTETLGAAAQSCNVQLEPWEQTAPDDGKVQRDHVETMLTVTIGSSTGDVSDVKVGGVFAIEGFDWSVINIAMRTGQTSGWARLRVLRSKTTSIGSPGSIMSSPSVSPGGRFDQRGK